MTLDHILGIAAAHLRSGHLDNEAQVKQAVILPILRELGWNDTDPEAFKPEYTAGSGRVDYALMVHGRPMVFIEAKKTGNLNIAAEEQLFGYAANRGVPLLVLTDGDRWDFYLSMAAGVPAERCFYRMALQSEHKISEYEEFLKRYLQRDRVVSGDARRNAEQRLESNRERERSRQMIPVAWRAMLETPDVELCDLLAKKVEINYRIRPESEDIKAFLRSLDAEMSKTKPINRPVQPPVPVQAQASNQPWTSNQATQVSRSKSSTSDRNNISRRNTIIVGFVLDGEEIYTKSSIQTLVEIVKRFGHQNPKFMDRFAENTIGRTRRLVARERTDLFNLPHLVDKCSMDLGNGWYLGANLSTASIRKHIRTACKVAEIDFDVRLKLIEK